MMSVYRPSPTSPYKLPTGRTFKTRGVTMLIRLSFDIQFEVPAPVAMVAILSVHPSRVPDLLEPDELQTEPRLEVTSYIDSFGNRCTRFVAPQGQLRLSSSTLIRDSGLPDAVNWSAREPAVGDLPYEILCFLLNSRYCEVDRFSNIAVELFGEIPSGWGRVQAICNWVHNHVAFNYQHARPTKTAWMSLRNASAFAATFNISPSRSAAHSTFQPAMQPAIWATLASPWSCPWTLAHGSKSTLTTAGGHSMPATTNPGLAACSWQPAGTPPM